MILGEKRAGSCAKLMDECSRILYFGRNSPSYQQFRDTTERISNSVKAKNRKETRVRSAYLVVFLHEFGRYPVVPFQIFPVVSVCVTLEHFKRGTLDMFV